GPGTQSIQTVKCGLQKRMTFRERTHNAFRRLGKEGPLGFIRWLHGRMGTLKSDRRYRAWRRLHTLTDEGRAEIKSAISKFKHQPLISIILPIYNVDERWLRLCIDSVVNQTYGNWELCIADDCSTLPHIRPILIAYVRDNQKIKV